MKKQILLLMVSFFSLALNAQLLLNETFNYNATRLANLPGDPAASATNNLVHVWYNTGKTADSNSASISIDNEPLYYQGYINSGIGKSAKIDWGGSGANTRVDVMRFIPFENRISAAGNVLYYSFLLNVENIRSFSTSAGADANDWRDVLCVTEGGSEVLGNSFRGRFFLQQDIDDPNVIRYTISKNTAFTSSIVPDAFGVLNASQTYLMVIKQTFTGAANCKVEVMHNPVIAGTEPSTGWINGSAADVNTFSGTYGISIRRRNLGSTAKVLIGGLRIARTYGEAVGFTSGLKSPVETKIFAENNTIVTPDAGKLRVYSLTGTELINSFTDGRYKSRLTSGMYLVQFTDKSGAFASAKLMIQ